ncbi:hypothetical protein LPJ70_007118 [Coemansia sp. RSA 2708]|nr:hypothetical protein LPJ70_007118 [Coemansia sp. RSA 2708]
MNNSYRPPPKPQPAYMASRGSPYAVPQRQRSASSSIDLIESDTGCFRSFVIGCCCCCCCCRGEIRSEPSRGGGQYAGMWRIPMAARLRTPVVAALGAWAVFLAVLGFTRLLALPLPDKAQHFVGFGVLAVLVFFSFQAAIPRRKVWALTAALMGAACVLSEAVQRVVTSRAFEWGDVLANVMGTGTFLFAAWMADRWIVQPRAGHSDARYWALGDGGRASTDFEMDADLDLELDDILVDSPPPERS